MVEDVNVRARAFDQEVMAEDVTPLSPTVVMFNKKRISPLPNSNVYLGRQEIGNGCYRFVAIKLIPYSDMNLAEAQTLTQLNHPNIVQIYETGECRGFGHWIYIVMEQCLMNMEEYVKECRQDQAKALSFTKQILAALSYLHERNIAHRDIKPSNILISQCGNFIKVSDFGISKEIPFGMSSVAATSYGVGTEGFKAPEVYDPQHQVSLSSDIYSLGLVIAYLLSHGKHPFGDDPFDWSYKIRKHMKFGLSRIPLTVSTRQQLINVIKRMLQYAPGERPAAKDIANEVFSSENVPCQMDSTTERKVNGTIVLIDRNSKRPHLVNLINMSLTRLEGYPDDGASLFSAVSLRQHIYLFKWADEENQRPFFRLKYEDAAATWERLPDWPADHGWSAPAVASSDHIFLIGGGWMDDKSSKAVSKFNPSSNKWDRLEDKPTGTLQSVLLCTNEFLYCIGGIDESGNPTGRVDRMSLKTLEWTRIVDMKPQGRVRTAVKYRGKICVFSNDRERVTVQSWDPRVQEWTVTELISRRLHEFDGWWLRALAIEQNLYLVGRRGILEYEVESKELGVVLPDTDMDIWGVVSVSMPFEVDGYPVFCSPEDDGES